MKTLIVYYSYSGITEKVVKLYEAELAKLGEVALQKLKPKQEITTFLGQCRAAFSRKRAELDGAVQSDVKGYDLVILGSHGHGTLVNLVMGSVATQVLAHCKVPVLLVR